MSLLPANYRKILVFVTVALAALLLSRPAVARQAPAQELSQQRAGVLDGQTAPADQSDNSLLTMQGVLSDDDFNALVPLVSDADDAQLCGQALVQLLQMGTVGDNAGSACGLNLNTELAILNPYASCPGGDASQCADPNPVDVVTDTEDNPDGSTRAAPVPPDNVHLESNTATSLTIGWVPPYTGNPQTYQLYYQTNYGAPAQTTVSGSNTGTAYALTGLQPDTSYNMWMVSCVGGTCSAASNTEPGTTGHAAAPSAPTNVRATNVLTDRFTITWTYANAGATFNVFWGTNPAPGTKVAIFQGVTTYTLTGLKPSTQYYYTVAACQSNLCSPAATPAASAANPVLTNATPPPAPAPVALTFTTDGCNSAVGVKKNGNPYLGSSFVVGDAVVLTPPLCSGYKFDSWSSLPSGRLCDKQTAQTSAACSFTLKATDTGTRMDAISIIQLAPKSTVFRIAAIGDSISAGQGAPDSNVKYINGAYYAPGIGATCDHYGPLGIGPGECKDNIIPSSWNGDGGRPDLTDREDTRCHRSTNAPADLVATHDIKPAGKTVQFLSYACSGATIQEGLLGPQTPSDQDTVDLGIYDAPIDSQVGRLSSLLCTNPKYKDPSGSCGRIDALVLSIGANDLGWGDVLKYCAFLDYCSGDSPLCPAVLNKFLYGLCWPQEAPFKPEEIVAAGLAKLSHGHDYAALANAIKSKIPVTTIYMIGYMDPMMYNGQICSGNGNPQSGDGPDGFLLNGLTDNGGQNEATTAHNVWYKEMLDAERAGAAEIQEVTGVPTHFVEPSPAAQQHGYCAPTGQRWTNTWDDSKQNVGNPTAAQGKDFVTTGVFHPNAVGYSQGMEPGLAAAIQKYSLP